MCFYLLLQTLKTFGLVSFYYSFSISLTFYNKWVLMVSCSTVNSAVMAVISAHPVFSPKPAHYYICLCQGYPFPVSITMIHLIIKFLLAWLVRKVSGWATTKAPVELEWKAYLKHIAPIGEPETITMPLSLPIALLFYFIILLCSYL